MSVKITFVQFFLPAPRLARVRKAVPMSRPLCFRGVAHSLTGWGLTVAQYRLCPTVESFCMCPLEILRSLGRLHCFFPVRPAPRLVFVEQPALRWSRTLMAFPRPFLPRPLKRVPTATVCVWVGLFPDYLWRLTALHCQCEEYSGVLQCDSRPAPEFARFYTDQLVPSWHLSFG
jgi:hypothetical protein